MAVVFVGKAHDAMCRRQRDEERNQPGARTSGAAVWAARPHWRRVPLDGVVAGAGLGFDCGAIAGSPRSSESIGIKETRDKQDA